MQVATVTILLVVVILEVSCRDPSIPLAGCGQACGVTEDCTGTCNVCRLGVCVGLGKCNGYCDPTQSSNLWCYNDYCASCDLKTNSCRSDCNGPCATALQCAEHCPSCSGFRCMKPCQIPCNVADDCTPNADGCFLCTNKVCSRPTGCNIGCQSNSDCISNTDGCTKCVRNRCITGGCNSICYYAPDCIGQGNCTQCFGRFPGGYGVCTAGCGGACNATSQCNGTLTNCGLCLNGKCSPSNVCGVSCQSDAGCAGTCSTCKGGICSVGGTCGQPCLVNTQCDQSNPRCMYCINQLCGAP